MKYKIIALDMDGTLLPPSKKVPFLTKRYLKILTKKGYLIVLASGRPNRALEFYHRELSLNAPIVCYNGAYVYHPDDPKFPPYSRNIPAHYIMSLYRACLQNNVLINLLLETDQKTWVLTKDEYLANFFWLENHDIVYGDLEETLQENPITAIFKVNRSEANDKIIEDIVSSFPDLSYRFWGRSEYCEFYLKGTSKADGLAHVCKYYGLTLQDIVAFGDSYNDVEMLNEVGLGIVMSDAKEKMLEMFPNRSKKGHKKEGVRKTLQKLLK